MSTPRTLTKTVQGAPKEPSQGASQNASQGAPQRSSRCPPKRAPKGSPKNSSMRFLIAPCIPNLRLNGHLPLTDLWKGGEAMSRWYGIIFGGEESGKREWRLLTRLSNQVNDRLEKMLQSSMHLTISFDQLSQRTSSVAHGASIPHSPTVLLTFAAICRSHCFQPHFFVGSSCSCTSFDPEGVYLQPYFFHFSSLPTTSFQESCLSSHPSPRLHFSLRLDHCCRCSHFRLHQDSLFLTPLAVACIAAVYTFIATPSCLLFPQSSVLDPHFAMSVVAIASPFFRIPHPALCSL